MGGSNPETAYRRFAEEGLAAMPEDPFREAVGGWLLGSPKFVDRVRAGMTLPRHPDAFPAARRLACYDYRAVLDAAEVRRSVDVSAFSYRAQGSPKGECRPDRNRP